MLQFDIQSLTRDILKECERALKQIAEKAKQAMIYELSSHAGAGSHSSTGASEWNRQVGEAINYIAANTASEAVVKVGLVNDQKNFDIMYKALLLNFGMGRTADIEGNPWIAEYLVSDAYNTNRADNEVLTRPGERIYDLETGQWRESKAISVYEIEPYYQYPTYFFENGMRLIVGEFNMAIDSLLDGFDFSRYLKTV
jgi:hypothetical protein